MRRIDAEAFKAKLIEGWAAMPVPDEPGAARDAVLLMKRGAIAGAELAVFALGEVERGGEDYGVALQNIAQLIGSTLVNVTNIPLTDDASNNEAQDIAHSAIHIIIDRMSDLMHSEFYRRIGDPAGAAVGVIVSTDFEVPMKEVPN